MAVYVMPVNACIEVQVVGSLHGQTTRTTFHYRYAGVAPSPDGAAAIAAFLDNHNLQVGGPMRERASEEWTHLYTSGQMIFPTRYRAVIDGINQDGVQAGQSLPSGVAIIVRRQGLLADRPWNGRIYLPGVPVAFEDDSSIKNAERANYDALLLGMKQQLQGSVIAEVFRPIVGPKPAPTGIDDVETTFLDVTLRYQRRRELGVGE